MLTRKHYLICLYGLYKRRKKESFQKNRKKWDELFSEQLNNVKQFPDDIVSSVYSFYSSNSNYLLQIRKLHMVLFKLEMIQAINKLFYTEKK